MNENLNLVEILKDCPKGTKLYTPIWGEVVFIEVRKNKNCPYPICINTNAASSYTYLAKDGRYFINREESECILFPSKDQRDWSKFTAPWLKKERFDPKTFQPFDKVLVRTGTKRFHVWLPDLISIPPNEVDETILCMTIDTDIIMAIPYNEETKNLVGTNKEAPEFYRYWED